MSHALRKLAVGVFYLFVTELVLGGPGQWRIGKGPSLRKALFSLCFLLFSLIFLDPRRMRLSLRDLYFTAVVALSLVAWGVVIPLLYGTPLAFALTDCAPLSFFLFYVIATSLVRQGELDWSHTRRYLLALISLLATFQVVIWVVATVVPSLQDPIRHALLAAFNVVESEMVYVGPMPSGFYRVMWISSLYLIPAFFFVMERRDKTIFDYALLAILVTACGVSYSRGIWLGIAVGMAVAILLNIRWTRFIPCTWRFSQSALALASLAFSVAVGAAITRPQPVEMLLRRMSGRSEGMEKESVRLLQLWSLLERWLESPLFGAGFGGSAGYVRNQAAPHSYELTYPALLMKLGLLGSLLWISILVMMTFAAWRAARRTQEERWFRFWLGSLMAFLTSAGTNPYLMNFIGIWILAILFLEVEAREKRASHALHTRLDSSAVAKTKRMLTPQASITRLPTQLRTR